MKQKKKLLHLAVLVILAAAAVCAMLIWYSRTLSARLEDEIIGTLAEVSNQSAVLLRGEVENMTGTLEDLASVLGQWEEWDPRRAAEELDPVAKNHGLKRMGIITAGGQTFTTDGAQMDLTARPYFEAGLLGESRVSVGLFDQAGGGRITVYSVPLRRGGEVLGVLFATADTSRYLPMVRLDLFDGQGTCYLVEADGAPIMDSGSSDLTGGFDNFFDALAASPDGARAAAELKTAVEEGRSGYLALQSGGVEKYLYYEPVECNGWYLFTLAPTAVLGRQRASILHSAYLLCLVITLVFAALLTLLLRMQRQNRRRLEELVYVDPVTGGWSHERFCAEARRALDTAGSTRWMVWDLDIQYFKYINDIFGHEEGDRALRHIWDCLSVCAGSRGLFARRSADRFELLLPCADPQALAGQLKSFCAALHSGRSERRYELTPAIGVYEIEDPALEVEELLDRAQLARKAIKNGQPGPWAFYDEALRRRRNREREMEDQMEASLRDGDFFVMLQPEYSACGERLAGAEALVRWRGPDGGVIPPADFIPLFERNGFVLRLDAFVFESVCRLLRGWLDGGLAPPPVSVNLSPLHLHSADFVRTYEEILKRYSLPPDLIQLELTETALFDNVALLHQVVGRLREAGFRLLMDDFGTGYSSLKLLKNVPVDVIKLDKSFVDDIGSPRGESIIRTVIGLAHSLSMTVVAEGVEQKNQLDFLETAGCDLIQGYYFSRPLAPAAFAALLR
ncbi:EAL domain-containing protein [Anaerofilum sp. BX8]|uniref:EAL domain-containing protein n=1 Tax=Anaerofilum hominis TaxID=2763016 RepID=A0A923I664_9FIRM|nr:EAL domain-containing protein [Anaerofilum hominis]